MRNLNSRLAIFVCCVWSDSLCKVFSWFYMLSSSIVPLHQHILFTIIVPKFRLHHYVTEGLVNKQFLRKAHVHALPGMCSFQIKVHPIAHMHTIFWAFLVQGLVCYCWAYTIIMLIHKWYLVKQNVYTVYGGWKPLVDYVREGLRGVRL